MTSDIIIFCAVLLTSFAALFSAYRLAQGSFEYMPTLGWCFLMAFPFAMEFTLFNPSSRILHGYVVMAFLAVIFLSDYVSERKVPFRTHVPITCRSIKIAYALGLGYFVLTLFHLFSANSIPLFVFFQTDSIEAVDQARMAFSQTYTLIPGIKYVFCLSTALLGMPAILLLWSNRRYALAAILFAWTLFYCVASTAKGPFILVIIMACIGLIYMSQERMRIVFARSFLGLSLLVLLGIAAITLNPAHHKTSFTIFSDLKTKYEQPLMLREDRPQLLGDYVRPHIGMPIEGCSLICRKADYLAYRIFVTPIEVSARWYEYFTDYPLEEIRIARYVHDSRSDSVIHPAQAVGIWAFQEQFPETYDDTVHAYPSMDADVFGRFGWIGLSLLLVSYMGMRMGAAYFRDTAASTQGSYYAITIALLSFLPANAGMQAMLVAHGLGAVLIVLYGIRAWRTKKIICLPS